MTLPLDIRSIVEPSIWNLHGSNSITIQHHLHSQLSALIIDWRSDGTSRSRILILITVPLFCLDLSRGGFFTPHHLRLRTCH